MDNQPPPLPGDDYLSRHRKEMVERDRLECWRLAEKLGRHDELCNLINLRDAIQAMINKNLKEHAKKDQKLLKGGLDKP